MASLLRLLLQTPGSLHSVQNTQDILITEGDAMLISDVEVPEHDTTTLRLMLASAAQRNIKRLCILGDFLASDAFSVWPALHAKQDNTTYAQEFEIAVDIVAAMFTWFDEVYLIEGNHDRRANKATPPGRSAVPEWPVPADRDRLLSG